MVDDMVGAHAAGPIGGFGARRRRDHREAGISGELDRHRADAAGATDDEDGGVAGRPLAVDLEAVEQHLPGGDRRERQGGGIGGRERLRSRTDDPLVDELQLGVRARAEDRPGIEHPVAGPEQRHRVPCPDDSSHGIEAKDAEAALGRRIVPKLGVDRIDGDRLDPHQQVMPERHRIGQLAPDQGIRAITGAGRGVADRLHLSRWRPRSGRHR
jgi:hypothetical protein